VVGGGSAGCLLAAPLSEEPRNTVCLIEAGGSGRSAFVDIPGAIVLAQRSADLIAYIRAEAYTVHHPISTCRMGNDALAVVDAQLRVAGIEGLRVADASVFPSIVGGNTNAVVAMVAEKPPT
jgi:choline dehydrogenase-like flavoprotein